MSKKFFWLKAQPLVHRLLDLFVVPESYASHRLFERLSILVQFMCY
jgi:hypothetical protein